MKVRLKRPFAAYPRYFKALFQFHEGPIKTIKLTSFEVVKGGFNSMKVRLKLKRFA